MVDLSAIRTRVSDYGLVSGDTVLQLCDEIDRLRTTLAAGNQWQPIETLPPDTRVLLWFQELGYPVTGWPEAYGYKSGGWKPTHWQPAPAGPTDDAGGKP